MKPTTPVWLRWTLGCLLLLMFSSCFKDNCKRTYRLYLPVYKTLSEVRAGIKSQSPRDISKAGKIFTIDNFIFLSEPDKGIHIIDNKEPSAPRKIAFVPIPGNIDVAVNGKTLYADCYSDLITLDISNPQQIIVKNIAEDVFPDRKPYYVYGNSRNPDSVKLIAEWKWKDTTIDCDTYAHLYNHYYLEGFADSKGNYATPAVGGKAGKAGSMARFALLNDYLYTVTTSNLNVFDLSQPHTPSLVSKQMVGWNIETIYPFKQTLFIGSTAGMFIYSASNPVTPVKLGQFSHVTSCDPVVADEQYAYVTLRSGRACQGFANQLEVINITDLMNPQLLSTYPMTNPHGLAKDNNLLFICDGSDGLKVYDARNAGSLKLLSHIGTLNTYDVIAENKHALVVASDGLYQFNYFNESDLKLISKISFIRDL